MKKMRITLNQKVYEVTVEVLEDDESYYPGATSVQPPPRTGATPPPSPAAAPRPSSRPGGAAGQVLAPIVGTVTKVLVKAGEAVKENQPLVVLDAMKMDTYINSPRDGEISTVECAVGDNVHVGQQLLTLK